MYLVNCIQFLTFEILREKHTLLYTALLCYYSVQQSTAGKLKACSQKSLTYESLSMTVILSHFGTFLVLSNPLAVLSPLRIQQEQGGFCGAGDYGGSPQSWSRQAPAPITSLMCCPAHPVLGCDVYLCVGPAGQDLWQSCGQPKLSTAVALLGQGLVILWLVWGPVWDSRMGEPQWPTMGQSELGCPQGSVEMEDHVKDCFLLFLF